MLMLLQFSSVAQLCPTLCDPMNCSMPGLPVHHQLLEFTQTHIHRVSDAIQPSHPVSSPSPPAPNLPQHQGLFQWVNSSHQVARVLELQLQHQSFQWILRVMKDLNGIGGCGSFNYFWKQKIHSNNTRHYLLTYNICFAFTKSKNYW